MLNCLVKFACPVNFSLPQSMGSHETSLADMSTRLSDQEAVISHLEKELISLQTSFETERNNMQMQVIKCIDQLGD